MSFRTKIALLAGVVTGGIILGLGWLLWSMTYRLNLESLDKEALQFAQTNLRKAAGVSYWERLDDSLVSFNEESGMGLLFRFWVEPFGRRSYVSPGWPLEIDPQPYFTKKPSRQTEQNTTREDNSELVISTPPLFSQYSNESHWRVGLYFSTYGNLALAFNIDTFDDRMNRLKWRYFLLIPLAIVLAFGGAWFVAFRSLRPLEKLTSSIESLDSQQLDQRVSEVGFEKEFHRLVGVFNGMMARLENSFHQASRFSADASHELKTPLTRLQMEVEKALKESVPASKEQTVYSSLLDEIGRLSSIVKNLTLLSSSDAGKLHLNLEPIDLALTLESVVEDWKFLAEKNTFDLSIEKEVKTYADRTLIEQAIQNLVSNAVKHGHPEAPIEIHLEANDKFAKLLISNKGKPISEIDQTKLFDRFFRTDASRSSSQPGVGLGLSLTREIAKAHKGDVTLVSSDSVSTTFSMILPLAEA